MTPSDIPAVEERLRAQNERDGTSYSLPQVFDEKGRRLPRIPLALVAVDIDSGDVVQGYVWEATLELMTFGTNARATVMSAEDQDAAFYLLRERGYRDFHTLVPAERVSQMEHFMERRYRMSATGLTHFYRLLDPAENEALREFYEQEKEPA